jgi:thymidylate synthase (FAD)
MDPLDVKIDSEFGERDEYKIEVLPCVGGPKGFVRMVNFMGGDLDIVRSARVSYNADWRAEEEDKDAKLIKYLWKNKHTSPFECVQFTFEVKAPIFVFRQWHRHRTWSYNEISARYTELDEGCYVPDMDKITTQSKDNKQMRTTEVNQRANVIHQMMINQNKLSLEAYDILLKWGTPRELARTVLPVAAYSRMFATVDLHNLFHFLELRLHEHSQYEIRVYADAMLKLITPIVPIAVSAFLQERKI